MKKINCVFLILGLTLLTTMVGAQTKDTLPAKAGLFSKLNLPKVQLPKIHIPKWKLFKKDTTVIVAAANTTTNKVVEKAPVVNIEKPVEIKQADTTVKKSFMSKLSFPAIKLPKLNFSKKNSVKADTLIEKSTAVVEKAKVADVEKPIATLDNKKDTTTKKSFISKFNFPKINFFKKDSISVRKELVAKANSVKAKDSNNAKVNDTSSLYKTVQQKFLQYTATTTLSLLAGANFSKQSVDAGGFNSNFNYAYSDINEDVYKTGYFGGFRLDGKFKKKHEYSLGVTLSKISAGANYTSSTSLKPVIGSFSTFKAEDHFFVLNIAAHYKKLIPYGDLEKFKFYIVGGPSIDARLSNTSLDNQVTNAYKKLFIKGDLGVEFNNRSLYTLFFLYQHNIGSLTKSPINTNINSFQLGIMVKATDLL
jgi:hypothetical protein